MSNNSEIETVSLLAQDSEEADLVHAADVDEVERGIWRLLLQHFSK